MRCLTFRWTKRGEWNTYSVWKKPNLYWSRTTWVAQAKRSFACHAGLCLKPPWFMHPLFADKDSIDICMLVASFICEVFSYAIPSFLQQCGKVNRNGILILLLFYILSPVFEAWIKCISILSFLLFYHKKLCIALMICLNPSILSISVFL